MKNEERLKQVQQVQCSMPTSMSCILLCETRAKVCCKTGSMRPLLGGAAGSNLQALAETTRHRKHTEACQLYLGPLFPLCIAAIAINSDDLQHPRSGRFEVWDQGNKPECPLPGTHNIHARFTEIILRNFSISNR